MSEIETKIDDAKETDVVETKEEHNDNKESKDTVNVEKVKNDALAELYKELGVEDSESLQAIVKKAKEDEEAGKTELQKKSDTLTATTKELVNEREARIIAEAKLSAIQLGAKPELVEDLVIIAKSKVTKDKDINAIIAEIKDSTTGSVYFSNEKEENEDKKKNVTRGRVTKTKEKKGEKETEKKDEKHAGSMAERLLAGRKAVKSHYFK